MVRDHYANGLERERVFAQRGAEQKKAAKDTVKPFERPPDPPVEGILPPE